MLSPLLRLVYKLPNKLFPKKMGDHFQNIDIEIGERLLDKKHYPGFELRIKLDCDQLSKDGCLEDRNCSKLLQSNKYKLDVKVEKKREKSATNAQ